MIAKVTDPRFRTFWPRFGAAILDGLIVTIPLAIGQWIIWTTFTTPLVRVPWYLASGLAGVVYSIAFHARSGMTPGKRITGVRVFSVDGSPLSARQAILRDLIPLLLALWITVGDLAFITAGGNPADPTRQADPSLFQLIAGSAMAIWGFLELATMLTNSRRRSVHDFIAGSMVMRVVEADLAERAEARAFAAENADDKLLDDPQISQMTQIDSRSRIDRGRREER